MTFDEKTKSALKKIHDGGHILFREIGRVCDLHGIHYYLDSGNLIGAVREKSDIPWDDDADVSMTRADYEVFRKAAPKELGPGFLFLDPQDLGNSFFDFVPRVVLLNSRLKADSEEEQYYGGGILNHIVCDIFIVDDVSDCMLTHKWARFLQTVVYGMSMGKRYRLDLQEYSGVSRAVIAVLAFLGRPFRAKTLVRWYDRISRMEQGKNKKYGRCYFSNELFRDLHKLFKTEWFGEPKFLTIDGEPFPVPSDYEKVLWAYYESDIMIRPDISTVSLPHCDPEYVMLDASFYAEESRT